MKAWRISPVTCEVCLTISDLVDEVADQPSHNRQTAVRLKRNQHDSYWNPGESTSGNTIVRDSEFFEFSGYTESFWSSTRLISQDRGPYLEL